MADTIAIVITGKDQASAAFKAVRGESDRLSESGGMLSKSLSLVGSGIATVAKAAATAGAAGIAAVGGAFAVSTKSMMDFTETMSAVQANSGATAEEFANLNALALKIGKDTSFSAKEAAQGMEMLSSAGLSITDILGGAAKATTDLAAATGLKGEGGLATAAEIASSTMSVFGLAAEDMAKAVSGITGVTQKSKFRIDDYRLALAQGGGVAAAAGVEFEDFNTTIAALAPLFGSGSDAGTSLKQMLINLTPSSKKAKQAMKDLGLMTEEGANQFYDATGSLKSMADIADILHTATANLSEEQRKEALSTIFGTDAMRAAVGLAAMTGQEFRDLGAAIGQVDAGEQARIRLDNLSGDVEQLRGSLETAGIQLGLAFNPLLRELAQAALAFVNTHLVDRDWSPFVNSITQAVQWLQAFIPQVLGVVQALTQPGGLAMAFDAVREQLLTWGQQAIGWVIGQMPSWIEALKMWGLAAAQWALDTIPGLLINLGELRNQAVSWILEQAPGWIDAFMPWAMAFLQWIVDVTPDVLKEIGRLTGDLLDRLGRGLPGIVESLARWAAALIDWVVDAAPGLLQELLSLLEDLLHWIIERAPAIGEQLRIWANNFLEWVGPASLKLVLALGSLLGDLLTWIVQHAPEIAAAIGGWIQSAGEWFGREGAPKFLEAVGTLALGIINKIGELADQARSDGTLGAAIIDGIRGGLESAWHTVTDLATNIGMSIKDKFNEWQGALRQVGIDFIGGMWEEMQKRWRTLLNDLNGIVSDLPDTVKRLLGIGSPSKIGIEIGRSFVQGIGLGAAGDGGGMPQSAQAVARGLVSPMIGAAPVASFPPAGGGGGPSITVVINNAGSLVTEREITEMVRQRMIDYLRYNPALFT